MRTLARKLFVLAILGSSILSVGGLQMAAAEGYGGTPKMADDDVRGGVQMAAAEITSESYQPLDESSFGGAVYY